MDNPVFPPEIFGLIIEELGQLSDSSSGRAALCNLSQCVRAFYEPCRLHIWQTLYLHNESGGPFDRYQKRLESLSKVLGRKDGPAPLVKLVRIMFVNPEDNGEGEGEEGEDEEEEDEEEEDEEEADEAEDEAEESKNGAGHEEEYGGNEDSSDEEEEEGVDIAETTALAPPDTSREGPPNYGSDDDSDDNDSTDEDYDSAPDYEGSFSDRWTKALFEMFPKIFPHLSHLEGLELEGAYEDAMMSDLSLYGGIHGIRSLVDLIDNSLLKSFTVTRLAIPFLLLLRLPTCLERLMLANATWDRYREFELDGMVAVTDSLEKIAPKHLQLEVSPEFSNLLSQQPRSLFENLSTLQVNILCEDMLNNVHEHILPNAISTLEVLKLDYSELDDTSAERYSQRLESLLKSMKSAPRLRTLQFQLCSDHIHKPSPSCPSDPSRLVKAYLDSPLFHGIKRLELDVVWGYGDRSVTDCFVDRSKSELDVLDATLANEAAFPNLREVKVNFRARGRWNTATPNDRGARERAKEEQRRIAREAREAFSETRARGVEITS